MKLEPIAQLANRRNVAVSLALIAEFHLGEERCNIGYVAFPAGKQPWLTDLDEAMSGHAGAWPHRSRAQRLLDRRWCWLLDRRLTATTARRPHWTSMSPLG
ncbi:MAG: hypothetical protein M3291_12525 [Actinomycetota bacterium]|nr:hypothetical protein [Actinomycetota bacterium]